MSENTLTVAKEIKEGRYMMIDGIPCRVVQIDISKSGKHGSAKMRIVGIGVFDGQKKIALTPGDADVQVPAIERRRVQVLSVSGNTANVMDSESYEVYDIEIPSEVTGVETGKELEVMECMGKKKVERMR